jgi:hypothetical protein
LKKKTGFCLFRFYEKTLRTLHVATVARTVSRNGRNENATLATIPHNHKVPGIRNYPVPI